MTRQRQTDRVAGDPEVRRMPERDASIHEDRATRGVCRNVSRPGSTPPVRPAPGSGTPARPVACSSPEDLVVGLGAADAARRTVLEDQNRMR